MPREPANLDLDLALIGEAFVVVVVGGMGSIPGAFLAALLIAEIKAFCIGIGVVDVRRFTVNFSKLTLVAEFLVMAVVLVVRPWGLLGRPQARSRAAAAEDDRCGRPRRRSKLVGARRAGRRWCCCRCSPDARPTRWCWRSTC